MKIEAYITNLFREVFPERCCLCHRQSTSSVCDVCLEAVKQELNYKKSDAALDHYYLAPYELKLLQKWLHEIKFECNHRAASRLAESLKDLKNLRSKLNCDLVVPVPIHKKRKRKRGFNQVDVLFKGWIVAQGLPYLDIIERNKVTKPLFNLTIEERFRELDLAFRLNPAYTPDLLSDKTVCLIDDIYTSGATIDALTRLLTQYGVKEVKAFTFARA
jgi:ComF family protein